MGVQTLPADASQEDILAVLEADGAAIVANLISAEKVKEMVDQVTPFIQQTPMGRDDFSGRHTQRTGALVARTPACHDLILHPSILPTAERFLEPFTDKIILHLTQTIHINPGNPAQPLHLPWPPPNRQPAKEGSRDDHRFADRQVVEGRADQRVLCIRYRRVHGLPAASSPDHR